MATDNKKTIIARVDPAFHKCIKGISHEKDIDMQDMVVIALTKTYLENRED